MKISTVVPVFNSEEIIGTTIDRLVSVFGEQGWEHEIILVNDGSRDGSWDVLKHKAKQYSGLLCINLLKNYGQHNAVLCGIHHATGEWVVTLDDDMQNPPEEIVRLVEKAKEGHDVVFGRFRSKKHAPYRRLGSRLVSWLNEHVFGKPRQLAVSNFRLIHSNVADRIREYRTASPYITGLALMFAGNPAQVDVEHKQREVGSSNYNLTRIIQLVMRILFNYSAWPLRLVAGFGFLVSAIAFLLGLVYVVRALFIQSAAVPGWTTLVVLLSFFNGMTLLLLAMLGEYLLRLITQGSQQPSYHIRAIVSSHV